MGAQTGSTPTPLLEGLGHTPHPIAGCPVLRSWLLLVTWPPPCHVPCQVAGSLLDALPARLQLTEPTWPEGQARWALGM